MIRRVDGLLPNHCESCVRVMYWKNGLMCSLWHEYVYGDICRGYMDRDIYW